MKKLKRNNHIEKINLLKCFPTKNYKSVKNAHPHIINIEKDICAMLINWELKSSVIKWKKKYLVQSDFLNF
jgi:hypothetical protein